VRIGSVVAGAGQVGAGADGTLVDGVGAQTRLALANVLANMAASGASADDVISVRVFLTERAHFTEMNEAYAAAFTEPYPARTTVYVGLPEGVLVEIDALAVLSG
jgi:enamine deaminase RidA (YjgF/YER057c/UK114 family)